MRAITKSFVLICFLNSIVCPLSFYRLANLATRNNVRVFISKIHLQSNCSLLALTSVEVFIDWNDLQARQKVLAALGLLPVHCEKIGNV